MKISPEDIDSFCLEVHDYIERHPLTVTEEGFDNLHEFIHQRFEKYFSPLIGDYNYN